jgi:hypothetical protein
VDGSNPKASDANPGTKNSLFAPSTRRPEFLVLGNASSSQQVFIENGSARFEMERVVTK